MLKRLFPLFIVIIIFCALAFVYFLFFPPRLSVAPPAAVPTNQQNDEEMASRLLPSDQEKAELAVIKTSYGDLNNEENRRMLTDNKIYEYALAKQSASACAALESRENTGLCLFNLAQASGREEFCTLISPAEAQANCREQLILSRVKQTKDPSECADFTEEKKKQCQTLAIEQMSDPHECEIFADAELKINCQSEKIYQQAMVNNEQSLCQDIPLSWQKANCLAAFLKINVNDDADGDGLKFYEEIHYGTDPDKADTDGDGYKDQEEIQAGFDPLGPGSAVVPLPAQ